jgi:hypothetical protein
LHAVETFAAALAARFNPVVGCTRSWDTPDPTDFVVIIDNMMSLEVLFNAADLTGNDTLRQIAISHADKTIMNHIRADGALTSPITIRSPFVTTFAQGRRSKSLNMTPTPVQPLPGAQCRDTPTPAPGAVVKHGVFTALQTVRNRNLFWVHLPKPLTGCPVYSRTHLVRYLDTARHMAEYFLDHIPADGIIPWDFNAPLVPPRPADSSAALIAANGLLLLAQQEESLSPANRSGASYYVDAAIKVSLILPSAYYALNVVLDFVRYNKRILGP